MASVPALLGPKKSSLSSVNVAVGVAAVVILVQSVGLVAGVVVLVVVLATSSEAATPLYSLKNTSTPVVTKS